MSTTEENEILHEYDGIQEYDNPLPGWWSMLFVGSIAFAILYQTLMWMHPDTLGMHARYEASVTNMLQKQFASLGELEPDEATIMGFVNDPEERKWLDVGRAVFQTNCVSCHGRDGGGSTSAPNLTDDSYINIKQVADLPNLIRVGAKQGAMPAWGNRLLDNEIVLVSAYVASLRGSNVAGGKGAEGEVIAPWPSN
ncbi:Cbb3-type cytochrome c oxidase subunit CcoP2 [Planctomycetes bacterium Pla163]|uniref:Cbb3-type cytochrome c oxidase subunit CcoP2 n=1 Tax=Rohdeia mirabilis TaxID=2528008 RepID=A0A518CY09_9BACT|nr:Cbb3-type cytochrome c oxidase subunit CcoP2 [Planctomycetes bacterium Pla163]